MMDLVDYVGALVRLSGGQIVGKTRLQKIVYLLEAKGLGLGLDFDYHNYGPFSPELAFAADDAESLGYISTDESLGWHSVPYTIFISTKDAPRFQGDSRSKKARLDAVIAMSHHSALVLEIAATAVYLKRHDYPELFWQEVKKRKPLKATSKRVGFAKELIAKLEL